MPALLVDAVYLLVIVAALPWLLAQSLRKGKYREGYAAKLLGCVPRRLGQGRCIWLHAVSVGEVNLLVPLVAELRRRWPDCQCLVSTTTTTGMALARSRFGEASVFYCPLDFSFAVRRAMRRIRPDLLVLAELELWPNLIAAARRSGAQVAVVNGRLSSRSFKGYRRIRPVLAQVLAGVDLIAAQTDDYADRFRALGARAAAVHVTGSIKFDGAETDRLNAETQRLRTLAGIGERDVVLLAGSTQEPEEEIALAVFRDLAAEFPQLKLILVPRHADRFERVAQTLAESGLGWQRRSALGSLPADPSIRITLVDAIGELRHWWGAARIAFVGGSLGSRGGQNMIEPAAYGCAVSFGPNTQNFRDVVHLLLESGAAVVVHDRQELSEFAARSLRDPAFAQALGSRARQVVLSQLGATRRTADLVQRLLPALQPDTAESQAAA